MDDSYDILTLRLNYHGRVNLPYDTSYRLLQFLRYMYRYIHVQLWYFVECLYTYCIHVVAFICGGFNFPTCMFAVITISVKLNTCKYNILYLGQTNSICSSLEILVHFSSIWNNNIFSAFGPWPIQHCAWYLFVFFFPGIFLTRFS